MAITDLTNTKWVLNETILYDSNFPTYDITYNAYCESGAVAPLSGLYMEHVANPRPPVDFYAIRYTTGLGSVNFSNFFLLYVLYTGDGTAFMVNSANEPTYNVELFNRTIEITGGTDVTNATLIAWLESNATLAAPTPSSLVSVTYNSQEIISATGDATYTLSTNGKYMNSNVVITANDLTGRTLTATYGGETILSTSTNGTYTLSTNGKYMTSNIVITIATAIPDDAIQDANDNYIVDVNDDYITTTETQLITFTTNYMGNISTYQSEQGMTWNQWVNSTYNTDDFYIIGNEIGIGAFHLIYPSSMGRGNVLPTDTIQANIEYLLSGGSND